MKRAVLFSFFILQGCVTTCVDTLIARAPKPIDEVFSVDIRVQGTSFTRNVQCEEYYVAQCSARGNYWAVREAGTEGGGKASSVLVEDPQLGTIEVPVPRCTHILEDRPTQLWGVVPNINGKNYWLVSSQGSSRTYNPKGANGDPSDSIVLELSMSINGKPLVDGLRRR